MTEPADICRSTPPDSVVNAGPCILRPGHRGTIHQDLHGWQWTTPPHAEVLQDEAANGIGSFGFSLPSELDPVSDLDRGESPFGWSSSARADSSPDRIRTAPDSTRTRQPDTTLTSTDTDPDSPDPESAEATVTRVVALHEQWVKAGFPPLGVNLNRWWDSRLAELHNAIQPADQTTEK
ncbi:hypothetical protein [Streptomyces olivaceus]|uniref:hypothetical protein n=1 Tax=Streptomyces olivaceus TaxID=47716 RepID=UPI0022EDC482|nr:hypothetical protein [Streptomyces olivaceus]GHI91706.1 hypothetical protein TPA0905_11770 [Streptomyces olivaceus]